MGPNRFFLFARCIMANVSCEHIALDKNGVARIAGSRIKVSHLVVVKRTDNLTAEQVQAEYPHLSMSEVYAAFAYYFDHQAEIDAQIERENKLADELERFSSPSPTAAELRSRGRIP